MFHSDFEGEDLALVGAIAIATAAAFIDAFVGHPLFKALKIVSMLLSLGLAVHRIRTAKPYLKDVPEADWEPVGTEFELRIPKSEHGRGKFPHARCLVTGGAGGYAECLADAEVREGGEVVIRVGRPASLRVEVRK